MDYSPFVVHILDFIKFLRQVGGIKDDGPTSNYSPGDLSIKYSAYSMKNDQSMSRIIRRIISGPRGEGKLSSTR